MCLHNGQHVSVVCGWLYPRYTTFSVQHTQPSSCVYSSFVENLLANPEEERYRRVNLANMAFQTKVFQVPGGEDAMVSQRTREGGRTEPFVFRLFRLHFFFIALPVSVLVCIELRKRPLSPL